MFGEKLIKKLLPQQRRSGKAVVSAAEEARAIRENTDILILDAAWEEYVTIKRQEPDFEESDIAAAPTWEALTKTVERGGNFMHFTPAERPLLEALRKGFLVYNDVLHVLIDHHQDAEAAADLYNKYPELHQHLPQEYDSPEHIIEVLVEAVREYHWQLEHFSMVYGAAIDAALAPDTKKAIRHLPVALPDAHEGSYAGAESYLSNKDLRRTDKRDRQSRKIEDKLEKKAEKQARGEAEGSSE